MAAGKLSVTEAAAAVGYASLSQFIRTFRQTTGRLPSDVTRFGS
jgi:AraC-like DNA-binding protein